MECKSQKAAKRFPCIRELIDTLWNVNENLLAGATAHDSELIDTLWNVNNCLFSLYCRKQY